MHGSCMYQLESHKFMAYSVEVVKPIVIRVKMELWSHPPKEAFLLDYVPIMSLLCLNFHFRDL